MKVGYKYEIKASGSFSRFKKKFFFMKLALVTDREIVAGR
jgi:hypothetical protein